MNIIVEFIANFFQMGIWLWFISSFFGFKEEKNKKKNIFAFGLSLVALLTELYCINKIVVYDGFLAVFLLFTVMLYAFFALKGTALFKFFISVYSMAVIFTVSSLVLFIFSYFTGHYTENLISEFSLWRVAVIVLCRVLEFLIFKFMLRMNYEYKLKSTEWGLFIAMPLFTWITITIVTRTVIKVKTLLPQMLYIVLIMVFINVIVYYFMYKIKQDTEREMEYNLLKMQYDNIKNAEMNMKALYDNTYSVRHDIEKHFLAIKTLAEKNKCVDIGNYIENIYEKNFNNIQKIIFTDNDVFNAVINTKMEICRQKGIFPNINICDNAVNFIKDSDIAVIFGNIFDNAIEAVEKAQEKIIVLNVRFQGEYISICMENNFNRNFFDLSLKTTKKINSFHGYGTKNIKKVVEDNNGMVQFFENNSGMFCCDILLPKTKKQPNSTKNIPNSTF